MRSVVHNFRIDHSIVAAVAVAVVADAVDVVGVVGAFYGWPSLICSCRLAADVAVAVAVGVAAVVGGGVLAHGSFVAANMVPLSAPPPIDAILATVDYFAMCSCIAEPVQWDSVYALVVADTAITIQQLMSLRNIQIHCLCGSLSRWMTVHNKETISDEIHERMKEGREKKERQTQKIFCYNGFNGSPMIN